MWKNLFESLLDLENLERNGESSLREKMSEMFVCVFGIRPRGREGKEESDFDKIDAWKYELHAWRPNK